MKAIFAVFGVADPAALGARIQQIYPDANFPIGPGEWVVLDEGVTTKEVSDKLGVSVEPFVSTAIVVPVTNYYGRYSAALWEWIKVKAEPRTNAS